MHSFRRVQKNAHILQKTLNADEEEMQEQPGAVSLD